MNVTIDHNCIIDALQGTPAGMAVLAASRSLSHTCFVVNAGASERLSDGTRPEEYARFEELLRCAGLDHLPRLDPPFIWGVTFEKRSVFPEHKADVLAREIEDALFPDPMQMFLGCSDDLDSKAGLRILNRLCDILGMWCHIHYGNDIFCTSDRNFHKSENKEALLRLGANRICTPSEL